MYWRLSDFKLIKVVYIDTEDEKTLSSLISLTHVNSEHIFPICEEKIHRTQQTPGVSSVLEIKIMLLPYRCPIPIQKL